MKKSIILFVCFILCIPSVFAVFFDTLNNEVYTKIGFQQFGKSEFAFGSQIGYKRQVIDRVFVSGGIGVFETHSGSENADTSINFNAAVEYALIDSSFHFYFGTELSAYVSARESTKEVEDRYPPVDYDSSDVNDEWGIGITPFIDFSWYVFTYRFKMGLSLGYKFCFNFGGSGRTDEKAYVPKPLGINATLNMSYRF